ncbi:MAG: hypothetical protein Q4E22_04595 [Coriobacteriia bacterium]|nr:hypothetical protein [Coriobacteriia bacterium]
MNESDLEIFCPTCGMKHFDMQDFDHAIVVSRDFSILSFTCPSCSGTLTSFTKLSGEAQAYINDELSVLAKVYPGSNLERFSSDKDLRNEDERIKRFSDQLDKVFGVDDLITKIHQSDKYRNFFN